MKDVRLYSTENEKIAQTALGTDSNFTTVNMQENSIDALAQKEKARKFNSEVETYQAQLDEKQKEVEEAQKELAYDITKAEIKPLNIRILIKPFVKNPFQKMEVQNGIILTTGGYRPHAELDPITGKYKEQEEFIKTGYVVEVGPECRYLKEGDVVFYRKDTSVPVPFFTENLVSIAETQVIAVVAESLTERFNDIKK